MAKEVDMDKVDVLFWTYVHRREWKSVRKALGILRDGLREYWPDNLIVFQCGRHKGNRVAAIEIYDLARDEAYVVKDTLIKVFQLEKDQIVIKGKHMSWQQVLPGD